MQTIRYSDRTSPLQTCGISAVFLDAILIEIKHAVLNYSKILLMIMHEVLMKAGVEEWPFKKLSFFHLTYLII